VTLIPELGVAACGALLLVLGVAVVVAECVMSPPRAWVEAVRGYVADLQVHLAFVRSPYRGGQVALAQSVAIAVLVSVGVATGVWLLAMVIAAIVGVLPMALLRRARMERVTQIESQLDTWLLVLANALKAIPALGEAMASSVPLVGGPLGEELTIALREHALGSPLNVALRVMATRVASQPLAVAATTLEIARRTGGALSDTLESSAASLREIARLEGVVRTKTAEAKSQAWVVSFVPAVVIGLLHQTNPEVVETLIRSPRGHVVLAIAAAMWIGAIASAIKILDVDV